MSGSLLYLKGQAISSIPSVIGRKGKIEKSWSQIWLDWINIFFKKVNLIRKIKTWHQKEAGKVID